MNEILWVDTYDIEKKIIDKDDHILAIGGDGTLLKAINKYKHLNKPFFGYAKGTVNFLMNQEIEPINNSKFKKFNLIRVQVTAVENGAEVVRTFQAFNDIVLGAFNGWINFNCTHRDNILGNFWGSGIVISTAQGSTGINKNNYGTILPLTSKNWSVTQGSQFTSDDYIKLVESNRVKISMDGKGRWADNIPIERWFRTLKYEEIYLKDYENIKEARREIGKFIKSYNFERIHSAINTTPAYSYYPIQLYSLMTSIPTATLDRPA